MSKTVPSAVTVPNIADLRPGSPVLAATWKTMAQTLHYVYGRQGAVVTGPTFVPYWTSLDYSAGGDVYHSVSDATEFRHLDDWNGTFRFQRLLYDTVGGDQAYQMTLNVYARNLDVRATLTRLDTADGNTSSSTASFTLTTSHAQSDSEWQLDTLTFTKAQASRGGSAVNGLAHFLVHVEAKVPAAGTGQLWCFGLRETPITAGTALPRGA